MSESDATSEAQVELARLERARDVLVARHMDVPKLISSKITELTEFLQKTRETGS